MEILCLGIQIVQLRKRFESSISDYIVRGDIRFKAFDEIINNKWLNKKWLGTKELLIPKNKNKNSNILSIIDMGNWVNQL